MRIEFVKVGYLETNCYILSKGDEVLVIDPGDEGEKIAESIGNRKIAGVVITHHHFDHIGALDKLESMGAPVYDVHNMKEGAVKIEDFEFRCIYTPGHKEDSVSLYFENENVLFAGDFIFQGTIGRWDLPGGSPVDMIRSIENILNYPDDMKIYPGHGEATTLGAERKNLESFTKRF